MNLYIFFDESGTFDFSSTGSKHYIFTCVSAVRPLPSYGDLIDLKYDILEDDIDLERFHATDDHPNIRNKVFKIIEDQIDAIRIDSVVVEKRKTHPSLQNQQRFYSYMIITLIQYVLKEATKKTFECLTVITDRIPVEKKRSVVEGLIKTAIKNALPEQKFRVYHHTSASNIYLQVADYCCWAINRKWEQNDDSFYKRIEPAIKSEFEIFKDGKIYYY